MFETVQIGFFGLDIIINFFSAFYDNENVLVTNNKFIAATYLKSWFIIDLSSTIPVDDIVVAFIGNGSGGGYNSLVRLARIPRLYKLVRILKLLKFRKNKNNFITKLLRPLYKLDASIKRMIKIMLMSLFVLHLSACIFF